MTCRYVTVLLLAAGLLTGCDDFKQGSYEVQKQLGMYPVDPPRAEPQLPPAGTVSQANWAAQRAAANQARNQGNTTPVNYQDPEKLAAEAEAADRLAAAKAPSPVAKPPAPASRISAGRAVATSSPTSVAAAATGTMAAAPADVSGWRAHLASHRTESAAINEWQELLKGNPSLYGQFDPQVEWVDTPNRGAFARLVLVGFAERKDADAACAKIRSSTRYCSSVKD